MNLSNYSCTLLFASPFSLFYYVFATESVHTPLSSISFSFSISSWSFAKSFSILLIMFFWIRIFKIFGYLFSQVCFQKCWVKAFTYWTTKKLQWQEQVSDYFRMAEILARNCWAEHTIAGTYRKVVSSEDKAGMLSLKSSNVTPAYHKSCIHYIRFWDKGAKKISIC